MAKAARFWPIDLSDRLEPSNPNQDARPRPKQSAQPVPKTPNQATQPNARPDRSLRSPDPLVRVAYRTRPPSARLFHPESFGLATRLGPNRPAWLNRTVCLVEPNRPACTKTRLKSFNSGLLDLGNPCRIFVKLAREHLCITFLDGLRYGAWL